MTVAPLCLLSLLCGLLSQALGQDVYPYNSTLRARRAGGLMWVCISDNKPMVDCDGKQEDNFTGYMVQVFDDIAQQQEMVRGVDYRYRCMEYAAMMADMQSPNGTCAVSAAGVYPWPGRTWLTYSWPVYKQGLRVLVSAELVDASLWSMFKPFTKEVWLALLATSAAVGLLLWLMHCVWRWAQRWEAREVARAAAVAEGPRAGACPEEEDEGGSVACSSSSSEATHLGPRWLSRLQDEVWGSVSLISGVGGPEPRFGATHLVVLAYAFMNLILVNTYTAQTAAAISNKSLSSGIRGLADLRGRRVATWTSYEGILRAAGVDMDLVTHKWDNSADDAVFADWLYRGVVDAVVLDASWVNYMDFKECGLYGVGERFATFDLVLAYPRGPGPEEGEVQGAISRAILELQREKVFLDEAEAAYVDLPGSCSLAEQREGEEDGRVRFREVAGLWAILAMAFLAALLCLALHAAWVAYTGYCRVPGSSDGSSCIRNSRDCGAPGAAAAEGVYVPGGGGAAPLTARHVKLAVEEVPAGRADGLAASGFGGAPSGDGGLFCNQLYDSRSHGDGDGSGGSGGVGVQQQPWRLVGGQDGGGRMG